MHLSSRLLSAAAYIGAVASQTSGVMEVDLIFPRNETYAQVKIMPLVFAVQRADLSPSLAPRISYTIWDWTPNTPPRNDTVVTDGFDDQLELLVASAANISSSEPYFVYRPFTRFNTEGVWKLTWTVGWSSCSQDDNSDTRLTHNVTTRSIIFTTKNGAQGVDLVAVTAEENCPDEEEGQVQLGVAIGTDGTLEAPSSDTDWLGGDRCAVMAPSPTPTAEPCRVKVDSAAAESISASMTARLCAGINPPDGLDCPDDMDSVATPRFAVVGVTCLATSFGALVYILM